MNKSEALQYIEQNQDVFAKISDDIWDYAETAFREKQSAARLIDQLKQQGFTIEENLAEMETAFVATYGEGYPVIGILGEFDALSNLSQKAFVAQESPETVDGNGHGCGHNMLGAGSLAAAAAVKEYLVANKLAGTIKYFGCPGEEGGSGKAFMAKAGVFSGVDIALTWHPASVNGVFDVSLLANYQVSYKFKGTASHAAASPHLGRSALDAVELMNVGCNFLREHIIPSARIHYAITNTGGLSPNVVQPEAEVLYLMRAPQNGQVEDIYQRINKIAQGAAMMTETQVEIKFIKSCSNIVPNKTLFQAMDSNLIEIGVPQYTTEELQYAGQMMSTLTPQTYDKTPFAALDPSDVPKVMAALNGKPMCDLVAPFHKEIPSRALPASSDVGDVSWNVPTGQIVGACYSLGTPAHSWQLVSQGKSSLAHKGLIYAAKVMAATAIDALEHDEIIVQAKAELQQRLNGATYQCAIPDDVKPGNLDNMIGD